MKQCYRCRERKELEYFWKRQKWCIRCMRAWRRQPEVRARYRPMEQRQRDRHRRPRPVPVRNERGQFTGAFAQHRREANSDAGHADRTLAQV